jgi:hypothetical protein
MTAFSPLDAASEGMRMMRREPKAVVYWIAVWALALAAVGVTKFLTAAPAAAGGGRDALLLIRSFGPLAVVLVPTLLALGVMNTATVYRAVLQPNEHGWHLFKLGSEEARIAVVHGVGGVLLFLATLLLWRFLPTAAGLLFYVASPLSGVVPGHYQIIAAIGALATVSLEVWIAVRFSLAPVETFAQQRFPLASYWSMTRGHFWRLLGSYLLVFLEVAAFLVAFAVVGLALGLTTNAAMAWRGPAPARLVLLLALISATGVLGAALLVVPTTLICACQAFAYRAIARPAPPGAAEPELTQPAA